MCTDGDEPCEPVWGRFVRHTLSIFLEKSPSGMACGPSCWILPNGQSTFGSAIAATLGLPYSHLIPRRQSPLWVWLYAEWEVTRLPSQPLVAGASASLLTEMTHAEALELCQGRSKWHPNVTWC